MSDVMKDDMMKVIFKWNVKCAHEQTSVGVQHQADTVFHWDSKTKETKLGTTVFEFKAWN